MSDLDLDAIKARCEAATPGPWIAETETDGDQHEWWSYVVGVRAEVPEQWQWVFKFDDDYGTDQTADATFIAHARTDVPALVAEVERWKERAEVAKAAFQVQIREVERLLRVKLKEAHLLRIEAQNPGIDMDEVRRHCCE